MKLSAKQQIRLDIISKYLQGEIFRNDACAALEIKTRQFSRIVKAFREKGIPSLFHGNLGKTSANKTNEAVMNKITSLYKGRYFGFNLRHFIDRIKSDHFAEITHIPCYSTLRSHLIKTRLLRSSNNSRGSSHRMRRRYEKEGLMVQIDGSHHRWVLGIGPICLTAAIDDATGKILAAKFTLTETTFAAMDVVEDILNKHGKFQMLYTDKAGIYGGGKRDGFSHMNRSLKELGIISIQAHSAQAKGRVERLFGTLQSRLINDMRVDGVRSMNEANEYLKTYLDKYNKQFAKPAVNPETAYKKLESEHDLNEVFSYKIDRQVNQGQVVSFNSIKYVVEHPEIENLVKYKVEVRLYRDGSMKMFLLNGDKLSFKNINEVLYKAA